MPFSLPDIKIAHRRLAPHVRCTPTLSLRLRDISPDWPSDAQCQVKLELFQLTGTFKARGALMALLDLDAGRRGRGVTAVSAGNHAIAVAWAARATGVSAKVVMPEGANPFRVALAKSFGAEVVFADRGEAAFRRARQIETEEGRAFLHPFEGPAPVMGSATLGLEWFDQCGQMDAIVLACGGGGLLAGVGMAAKSIWPNCEVFGVEPIGADAMARSLEAGQPLQLDRTATIADSLAPPMATPYTFSVCQKYVTSIACVTDEQIRRAMRTTLEALKLAVEPAGATALAGLLGPLRSHLLNMGRVGLLICGANIDAATFAGLLQAPLD